MTVRRRGAVLSALAGLLWLGEVAIVPAAAQSQTQEIAAETARQYDIPPGPLSTALSRFADAAGLLLSVDGNLTQGKTAAGLHGTYTVAQALERLLAGTGLVYRRTGADSWTVERETQDGVVKLDAVRVEGDAPVADEDKAYATAGSSTHISQQQIERFRGTSVGDIFQGTPGVLVGENRNSGGLDINIRGMQGQGRVPVLIDGSRQETTVWRGYAGVASRSYVDPDLIGGIDITKGPTLGAEGTGAVGGIVSMRTIDARDIVKDGKDWGLRVRASGGGNNGGSPPPVGTYSGYALFNGATYYTDCAYDCQPKLPDSFAPDSGMDRPGLMDLKGFAGSIAVARRFEHFDLVAAYAQREQGNYYAGSDGPAPWIDYSDTRTRPFDTQVRPVRRGATIFRAEEEIANTSFESRSALLKAALYLPVEQQLELGYIRYDSNFGEMMPSRINSAGWWAPLRQWVPSDAGTNTYIARYRWQPAASNWLDLRSNLWHTDMRSVINTPGVSLNDDVFGGTTRERYRRWGFDLGNTSGLDSPLGRVRLNYGITAQLEDIGSGGRDGERSEYSAFASAAWTFARNWELEAGLRYTRFHSQDDHPTTFQSWEEECVDQDGDGACDPLYYDASFDGVAPMATLLWNTPVTGLQLYARYAEGLRMPSLFETTSGWSVSPSFDINLRPERAQNVEAGINLLRDGVLFDSDKLRAKFAYFRNHMKDYLTRTPPNTWENYTENGEYDYFSFFRLRNIDSADFHGLEFSASYDAGLAFVELAGTYYTEIETCWVGSFRRYTCTDYGVPRSYINNMIPPDWHASALIGTRLFRKRLEFGLRGTFMGERARLPTYDDTQFGYAPPVPWHAYTLLDAYASWKHDDTVAVDFNIDNLTDQYYLDALSLGVLPAPGRTARVSVTLHF